MLLPIVMIPNPNLRKRSLEIDLNFLATDEFKKLVPDMIETMYKKDGVGLAAPQIGKNIRMCVISKEAVKHKKNDLVLINPVIKIISKKTFIDAEGCLSVPKKVGKVKRPKDILVNAINELGEQIEFEAHGLLARVVQHELDHLDGILFIDRTNDVYDVEENKDMI